MIENLSAEPIKPIDVTLKNEEPKFREFTLHALQSSTGDLIGQVEEKVDSNSEILSQKSQKQKLDHNVLNSNEQPPDVQQDDQFNLQLVPSKKEH